MITKLDVQVEAGKGDRNYQKVFYDMLVSLTNIYFYSSENLSIFADWTYENDFFLSLTVFIPIEISKIHCKAKNKIKIKSTQ